MRVGRVWGWGECEGGEGTSCLSKDVTSHVTGLCTCIGYSAFAATVSVLPREGFWQHRLIEEYLATFPEFHQLQFYQWVNLEVEGLGNVSCAMMSCRQRVDTWWQCLIVIVHKLYVGQPWVCWTRSCSDATFWTFWPLVWCYSGGLWESLLSPTFCVAECTSHYYHYVTSQLSQSFPLCFHTVSDQKLNFDVAK